MHTSDKLEEEQPAPRDWEGGVGLRGSAGVTEGEWARVGRGTMLGSRFCAACKGEALFSMDADPAHRCMHAGSRLAS